MSVNPYQNGDGEGSGAFVDFSIPFNAFLYLPNGTVPYGNSDFTISIKHGTYNNNGQGNNLLGSGTTSATDQANTIRMYNLMYQNVTINTDFITNISYNPNNFATFIYDSANAIEKFYVNSMYAANKVRNTRNSSNLNFYHLKLFI